MESINKRLENLYLGLGNLDLNESGGIGEQISSYNIEHDVNLDGPILMSSREEFYCKANVKILFVGQESYRLKGSEGESYNVISLMENNIYVIEEDHTNSPFWHTLHEWNNVLNLVPEFQNQCCYFWTNVSKYSHNGKPLSIEEHKFIVEQTKNILSEEIKIIEPDVVIFFSGPNYDEKISIQFNEPTHFKEVTENIPKREFAKVVNQTLPKKSFRTYHPGYARRKDIQYIQLVALSVLGYDVEGLMKDFKKQILDIAKELITELHWDPKLGQADSCFYFYKQEWPYGIGFGFDNTWTRNFYGGVYCKDPDTKIPGETVKLIQEKLGMNQKPTPMWPYWFWFDEHIDWNQKTFDEIKSGEFKKKIKIRVEEIIIKLEGLIW